MAFRTCVVVIAAVAGLGLQLSAQSAEKYTARLGWVPTAGAADRTNVTGRGAATATLAGNKLSITGSFDGLAAPATVARLHRGVAKAARGPVIGELTVTKTTSGTISGSIDLNAELLADLKQGRLYVQVHSEKGVAQDNSNLWGWLTK